VSVNRTAAAASVVLAVLGAGVYADGGGWAAAGPATIRVTDQQRADVTLGRGPGSREIVSGALYERERARRLLGASVLLCTYVARRYRSCTATYTLPQGMIVASGPIGSRLLYQLAIDGGTGLYDSARGTLTSTTSSLHPRRAVLIFALADY
jgi:hypothetical protein